MTQIALRNTADEALETHPEAARTLLEDSIADDICDSVSTVEKAQRLNMDIDELSIGIRRLDMNLEAW